MEKEEVAVQRRRRPTPDHPPYSEMVQCAIRALAEKHGSTESSISAYIQSHYDSLPWAHSRFLPYYLHKLLLAGEISKSTLPDRYILPKPLPLNPNPDSQPSVPRKRGRPRNHNPKPLPVRSLVKRARGRPPKIRMHEPSPNSDPPFDETMSMSKSDSGEQRPRLILKLKRTKPMQADRDGSVAAGCYWQCLREEVQEKDLKGIEADGQEEEEESAFQEKDLHGKKTDEHDENLLASQEEGFNCIVTKEHNVEFLASQEGDFHGITVDEQNAELLALKEKESNGVKIDGHIEELLVLQESNGVKNDGHNEELLALQEKESNGIKIDGHNEELLASQVVPELKSDPGTSCKKAKPKKMRKLWYEG